MYKLMRVLSARSPRCKSLKFESAWRDLQHRGFRGRALSDPSLYCGFTFKCKVWKWTACQNQALRSHSSETKPDQIQASSERAPSQTYSSVEPGKEEEFVFLDFSESLHDKRDGFPGPIQVTGSKKVESPKNKAPDLRQKALAMQLRSLNELQEQNIELGNQIEFHDVGFPLEQFKSDKKKKKKSGKKEHRIYGSPDAEVPPSDVSCSGCGALLHCTAPQIPGYVPSEKYKLLLEEGELTTAVCQRCFLLTHHHKALSVTMPREEYVKIVSRIKSEKALVLLIVDLLDLPDSIVPDLAKLVGKNKDILILGNKVDLLPGDSQNYLQRIKKQLAHYCGELGVPVKDPKDVHLVSAKTGYGIEKLITRLQTTWKYKGDVYLVGTANSGKSTLFNTLLESDYCKSRASDVIHKATISPWPGTTLNLLKFPIINPTPYRLLKRAERLQQAALQTADELEPEERKRIQHFQKQGYLIGRVGRTFHVQSRRKDEVDFDPDSLSFDEDLNKDSWGKPSSEPDPKAELTFNEIKDAHWFYDTPGILKEHDVLSLLNEHEVKLVVPTHAITPRTFVLKPGTALFLGALARIDYLEGNQSCWFTVVVSSQIPVHITGLEKADDVYQKNAGNALLAVPTGGKERMKAFPPLVPQDFRIKGRGVDTAVADIKLTSTGWVAVTAAEGEHVLLRGHAPAEAGLCLRDPPLLPHIVNLKGPRIRNSPAYRTKKPPALFDMSIKTQKKI